MNKKIMYVDDNLDERLLIRRQVTKKSVGLQTIEACGGQDAIDQLTAMSVDELPGMILLDLKMPKVDGLQVLKWIRCHEPTKYVPVVMFSTSDDEQDIANSYDLGANSYVIKSVNQHHSLDILFIYWAEINKSDLGPRK
ncbi:MAG: response regulator [Mariprofundus sp.]|nr:response regulator [Mariprofundus sp.]